MQSVHSLAQSHWRLRHESDNEAHPAPSGGFSGIGGGRGGISQAVRLMDLVNQKDKTWDLLFRLHNSMRGQFIDVRSTRALLGQSSYNFSCFCAYLPCAALCMCCLQLRQCGGTLRPPQDPQGIFHTLAQYEQAIKSSAQTSQWRGLRRSWLRRLQDTDQWSAAWYASLLMLVEKHVLAQAQVSAEHKRPVRTHLFRPLTFSCMSLPCDFFFVRTRLSGLRVLACCGLWSARCVRRVGQCTKPKEYSSVRTS
jgi:hypothetical protein